MRWCVPIVLAVAGCGEFNAASKNASPSTAGGTDTPTLDTGATTTVPSAPLATLESVALTFDVDALGDIANVVLLVTLWSEDTDTAPTLVCTHEVPVLATSTLPPPIDEEAQLHAFLELTLDEGVPDGSCPSFVPQVWRLGIGAYDARLNPAMDANGTLGAEVFGLYLQRTDYEPLYILGVAGTEEMFSGTEGLTADAPPLPEGAYQASGLYLLAFEG